MNSPASPRDFHVADTGGAQLLFFISRPAEDCVCVGINQAGSQQSSKAIDPLGFRVFLFEVPGFADGDNVPVFYRDRSVVSDDRV
jgi:hypothetical protein